MLRSRCGPASEGRAADGIGSGENCPQTEGSQRFLDAADFEAKKPAFKGVIRRWIEDKG